MTSLTARGSLCRLAAGAIAGILLGSAVLAPESAVAQTTFVSNTAQSSRPLSSLSRTSQYSQRFHTGTATNGYRITRVVITSDKPPVPGSLTSYLRAEITQNDGSNNPGTVVATLNVPSSTGTRSGNHNFDVVGGSVTLANDTTYHIVLRSSGFTGNNILFKWANTGSSNPDAGAEAGWSIPGARTRGSGSWGAYSIFGVSPRRKFQIIGTDATWTQLTDGGVRYRGDPTTGPTITGDIRIEKTITVDTSSITDSGSVAAITTGSTPDLYFIDPGGVFPATVSALTGGTSTTRASGTTATYTIPAAQAGKLVFACYEYGTSPIETVCSQQYGPILPRDVPAKGNVTITGTPKVDVQLSADTSGITNVEDGLTNPGWTYQWERADDNTGANAADITGATSANYTPTKADDQGKFLRVTVGFTDDEMNSETKTSDWTAAVVRRDDTDEMGDLAVTSATGVFQVDALLTADMSGVTDPVNGLTSPDWQYDWQRADDAAGTGEANISGARGNTYTPTKADDQGKYLRVQVSGLDDDLYSIVQTSPWTQVLPRVDAPATGMVAIHTPTGVTEILTDLPLTADVSGIADPVNGLPSPVVFTYQWRWADDRAGTGNMDIAGETNATYTPTSADIGKHLQVVVNFMDDDGYLETKISMSTPAGGSPPSLWSPAVARRSTRMDATGDVTITLPRGATVQVGDELEADATGVDDANGLGTFRYQWRRADDASGTNAADITGATATTYTPTAADDLAKHLQMVVRFTDPQGYMESVESDWTPAVMPLAVDATGDVTVSLPQGESDARVDVELTADTSAIMDPANGLTPPVAFTYQWRRADDTSDTNGAEIAGATMPTYTPVKADQGKHLRVKVTFMDDDGYEEMVDSSWTAAVLRRHPAAAGGDLTFRGTPRVNLPLAADPSGITDANGLTGVNWMYSWETADDGQGTGATAIAGETSDSYTPVVGDLNRFLRVTVRFMDDDDYPESQQSDWAGPILPADPDVEPTGEVTVSGTAQVDVGLEADVTGIDDANGLNAPGWTYQWRRADDTSDTGGANISGATAATYTPVKADEGKHLRVTATYTDDDGYETIMESAWTSAVLVRADTPATGDVALAVAGGGAVRVGVELAANTATIMDIVNGLTPPTAFTYQWRRANDASGARAADITDATASAYTPDKANDQGRHLQVVVTFTDDDGHEEVKESDWTAAVLKSDNAPAAGDVTFFGTPRVGVDLIARLTGVTDDNGLSAAGWSYQWRRADDASDTNGEDIADATAATYTPTAVDQGKFLRVTVRFTDDDEYPETRVSAWSAAVLSAFSESNTPAAGDLKLATARTDADEVQLTADTSSIADANGMATLAFTYQWQRSADARDVNAADIRGANTAMYMVQEADEGNYLRLVVYFTDDVGYTETKASAWARQGGLSEAEVFAAKGGLASFGRSVTIGLVDSIWSRVESHRHGRPSSHASLGGRAVDGSAFASGFGSRHAAKEAARLFGVEAIDAPQVSDDWTNRGITAEGNLEDFRSWAGIPDSDAISRRSSFALALDGEGGRGSMVYWGAGRLGSYESELDGDDFSSLTSEGSTTTFSLGLDYRMSETAVLGLAVSRSSGSAEYSFADSSDGSGEIDSTLTSVMPWLRWKSPSGLEVWGAFGVGSGEADTTHSSGEATMDLGARMIAVGAWNHLSNRWGRSIAFKADAFTATVSADGAEASAGDIDAGSQRIRVAAEMTPSRPSVNGQTDYALELGARHDGGDAETGAGLDVAGDFRHVSADGRVEISGRGSYLLFHGQEGFKELGLGLGVSYDPGADARGFQASLEQLWNAPDSDPAESMWRADSSYSLNPSSGDGAATRVRLGYGVDAVQKRALATLYGESEFGGEAVRMRLGAEMRGHGGALERLSLELYGEREEHRSKPADHAAMLEMRVGF